MNAFNPCDNNDFFINHIDGNKTNNSLNNLEWVTNKENVHHAQSLGLRKNKEYIDLICGWCKKEITIEIKRYNQSINKGQESFFCNKSCSTSYCNLARKA